MIIILEGVDKVGKTTLAAGLSDFYRAKIIKTSQPKTNDAASEYIEKVESLDKNENYVFDRFHLGEMVYGKIYRNKVLEKEKFEEIERKLNELNSVLIYCWQDHDIVAQNFIREKETFTNIEDIEKLDYEFRLMLYETKLFTLYWNYKINNFSQIIDQIDRRLKCNI